MATQPPREGQFLLYRTDEGRTRVECRFEQDSLWLSQASMAVLFDTSKQNIAKHLKAIFTEGELQADAVVNSWLTTAADGKRYRTAEAAKAKAQAEYDAWLHQQHALPSPAEQDMTRILEQAVRALPDPKDKKTS